MKNALILHGTNFVPGQKEHLGNWFPWLKTELEKIGYEVWLPELPEAWHPNLERYWNFLKGFDFNNETIIIGHSSGATVVFGLLHKLPVSKKVHLVVSVSGFYKNESGWNCEGLFSEDYDWKKIKKQSENISIIWSPNDPYISQYQTDYLAKQLEVDPLIFPNRQHFSLEAGSENKEFPELLDLIRSH
ncbi:MAG: hypothetical protein ACD_19C00114G0002 [uncultured bacterium]|nr:MAG: hypothetical protein ACD_19C00114G0002 [uncultured bacterium]